MHRWTMEMVTHYRKEMGWSQEEFATRLGYAHRQSVCNWITTGIPKEKFTDLDKQNAKDIMIAQDRDQYGEGV